MKKIFNRHKFFWKQKSFIHSSIAGVTLLLVSLIVNYFANVYTMDHAGNYVSDIILDNIPVVNVEFFFYDGFFLLWVFVILLVFNEPHRIPFLTKNIALFILIRSVFIMLTHLGIPPKHSTLDPNDIFSFTTLGNDMFFSSHSGLPFMMALVFWEDKNLRFFFILASIFFASVVLLGHLHYSIDVFAAFFISYTIFHISQNFFPKDYRLFMKKNAYE